MNSPEEIIILVLRCNRRLLRHLVGHHGHQARLNVGLTLATNLKSAGITET